MSGQAYPITGIQAGQGPDGALPLRREIDEWTDSQDPNDKLQVNLFLLALQAFQTMDYTNELSYFQVCGIHGQPLVPWNEITTTKSPGSGYCTHGDVLFPNWHRPYVLLFEQRIWEIMIQIINQFPQDQQSNLTQLANTWRFPYWDWAARKGDPPSYSVPQYCLNPRISVQTPNGTTQTIANPLYKFSMPNGMPMGQLGRFAVTETIQDPETGMTFNYGDCVGTSRWPTTNTGPVWVQGTDDNDDIVPQLTAANWYESGQTESLADAVYRMLSKGYFSSYDAFSSTALYGASPPLDYLSIEDTHNNLHVWAGGDGQMANVPVAAFDPIFWLHHCNVDRQYAIWQALNPTLWFNRSSQQLADPNGTWSIAPGAHLKPTTSLAPFYRDANGTHWTSDTVRDWTQLGYSYPELQPWLSKYNTGGTFNEQLYQADIATSVNALYGQARTQILSRLAVAPALRTIAAALPKPAAAPQPAPPTTTTTTREIHDDAEPSAPAPGAAPHGHASSSADSSSAAPAGAVATISAAITNLAATVGLTSPTPETSHAASAAPAAAAPAVGQHVLSAAQPLVANDYVVNVRYERFALGGLPFRINIFLGEFGPDAKVWHKDASLVGIVYNFSSRPANTGGENGCDNCHQQEDHHHIATGQVPLTKALLKHFDIHHMEPAAVEEYLKVNLHWRVSKTGGLEVPREKMASLKVSVAHGKATHHHHESKLTSYHGHTVLHGVTHDRPCGLNRGEHY